MVTFQNIGPGETLAPGSRVRTVWLLTSLGQLSAGVTGSPAVNSGTPPTYPRRLPQGTGGWCWTFG